MPAKSVHRTLLPIALAAAVLLAGSAGPALAQGIGVPATDAHVPGRILLMPRAGLSEEALGRALRDNGAQNGRRVGGSSLRIVDVPAGSERAMADRMSRHPHMKFAEVDRLSRPNAQANDPYLGSQWHLGKIGAFNAWDASQGVGVTIAVLDTGVDASHPDLAARLVAGWNFFNNTADTSDAYNHGTGVAGAAAAAMNNGIGVAGVSGQTRIMPIRISDATGYGSWSAMAQGLTYAADRGVRLANISYSSAATSSSVLSAAQYMKNKGGLVFISAGNTGGASTASATTSAIVVAATDTADTRTSWSTYGSVVGLAAPGSGIFTTTVGGGYVSESGTSFAAPVAAGVAALVMSANPGLTSSQVESILFSTAVDLGDRGRDIYYGWGRVDAAAATLAALAATPAAPTDTQSPTASVTSPAAGASLSGIVAVNVSVSDNVGVTRVSLLVNGTAVATDITTPFGFAWDSATVPNGSASLAIVAADAAGNTGSSANVTVNVTNVAVRDIIPPTLTIVDPVNGARVSGTVKINATASDNSGAAGITQELYIGDRRVATATGGSISYTWNTRKAAPGSYQITALARDAAGNQASTSVTVSR